MCIMHIIGGRHGQRRFDRSPDLRRPAPPASRSPSISRGRGIAFRLIEKMAAPFAGSRGKGHPAAQPGGVRGSRRDRPDRRGRRPLSAAARLPARRRLFEDSVVVELGEPTPAEPLSDPPDAAAIPDRGPCCASAWRSWAIAWNSEPNSSPSSRTAMPLRPRCPAEKENGRSARVISSAPTAGRSFVRHAPGHRLSRPDPRRPRHRRGHSYRWPRPGRLASLGRGFARPDFPCARSRERTCSSSRDPFRSKAISISPRRG